MHYMGLLDPPNETAISVWEDVSNVKVPDWSVFDSIGTLKYQLKTVLMNVGEYFRKPYMNSPCFLIFSVDGREHIFIEARQANG